MVEMVEQEMPWRPGCPRAARRAARRWRSRARSSRCRGAGSSSRSSGRCPRGPSTRWSAATRSSHGKPHPEPYLRAAELLGFAPGRPWRSRTRRPGRLAEAAGAACSSSQPVEVPRRRRVLRDTCRPGAADLGALFDLDGPESDPRPWRAALPARTVSRRGPDPSRQHGTAAAAVADRALRLTRSPDATASAAAPDLVRPARGRARGEGEVPPHGQLSIRHRDRRTSQRGRRPHVPGTTVARAGSSTPARQVAGHVRLTSAWDARTEHARPGRGGGSLPKPGSAPGSCTTAAGPGSAATRRARRSMARQSASTSRSVARRSCSSGS